MGLSQSHYRPHSSHTSHMYYTPTWGQPHNAGAHSGYGFGHHHHHHHHHQMRPGFGFGGPPPHLRKR